MSSSIVTKTRIVHCAFIIIIFAIMPAHVRADVKWSSASYPITEAGSNVVLAVGGDGVTTAVWRDMTGQQKVIRSARFQEFMWTSPSTLSDHNTSAPQVVVDALGSIFAVWALHQEGEVTQSLIQSRIFRNGSWGPIMTLDTIGGHIESNNIAIIPTQHAVMVALLDWTPVTLNALKLFEYLGGEWRFISSHALDKPNDETAYPTSLALSNDSSGRLILGWLLRGRRSETVRAIEYMNSSWGDEHDLSIGGIYTPAACGPPASLVLQSSSSKDETTLAQWLAPLNYSGCRTALQNLASRGGAWDSTPVDLAQDAFITRLVADKEGAIIAAWSRSITKPDGGQISGFPIRSARFVNGSWSLIENVLDGDGSAEVEFDITADGKARPTLITTWCGRSNLIYVNGCEKNEIESVRYMSGVWGEPVNVDEFLLPTPAPYYTSPKIAADSVGNITMAYNKELSVYSKHASEDVHELQVQRRGLGLVRSNPQAIDCGTSCSATLLSMAPVTLDAYQIPDSGYEFGGWSGDCQGYVNCSLVMDADKQVTATFTVIPKYRLKVIRAIHGTTTSLPGGVQCGGSYKDCRHDFYRGSTVKLTALPAEGFMFKKWKGCANPQGNLCEISMDKPRTEVTPIFSRLPTHALTVWKNRLGSVTADPPGLQCGPSRTQCRANYTNGKEVTLRLKPLPGHTFGGWSGDCSVVIADVCKVLINEPKNVYAELH